MAARGKKLTFELARFIKFMITEIFPGGRIPSTQMMVEHGEKAGFVVPETVSLRNHYIKTLGLWADALERNKDKAIAVTDEENYDRYMRYLKGCQYYFIDETHRRQPGDVPEAGGCGGLRAVHFLSAARYSSVKFRVTAGSTGMPGPVVVDTMTFFR